MISLFLLIFLLIIILPTTFKLFFTLDKEKINFTLKIYPLGLFGLQFKKSLSLSALQLNPSLTKQNINPPNQFNYAAKKHLNKHFAKHLLFILKCLTIQHFSLSAQLSLADRPQLFKFYGLYWAIYGIISPYLPNYFELNFTATAQAGNSYLALKSILSFSCGEIIIKSLFYFVRNITQKLLRRNTHGQPSYQ